MATCHRFFENEDQLREIWSDPNTRDKLLEDLSEAGYDAEKLDGMKDLIGARAQRCVRRAGLRGL